MTKADAVDAFHREASTYFRRYSESTPEGHSFLTRRRRVLELLDQLPGGGVVLDVGCGPGVMIEALRQRGWRYVGTDAAHGMLRESRSQFGADLRLVQSRIESLPFRGGRFDATLAMGVLEYLADPASALLELSQMTRAGGCVIVTLPNRASPYRVWAHRVYEPAAALVKRLVRRPAVSGLSRREFLVSEVQPWFGAASLAITNVVYYDTTLAVAPLDRLLPRAAVRLASRLETLGTSGAGIIGTGVIIAARKDGGA